MIANFNKDIADAEKKLKYAKLIGVLGRFLTFGCWKNSQKIDNAIKNCNDIKQEVATLNILKNDVYNLLQYQDSYFEVQGVRVSHCTFPDVAIDGRQTYGPYWESIRKTVLQRDNYRCCYEDGRCGGPLQIHHIRPLSKGGTNDTNNLLTLCKNHHGLQHPDNPAFR